MIADGEGHRRAELVLALERHHEGVLVRAVHGKAGLGECGLDGARGRSPGGPAGRHGVPTARGSAACSPMARA